MGRMSFVLCALTWNHGSNQVCMRRPSRKSACRSKVDVTTIHVFLKLWLQHSILLVGIFRGIWETE